MKFPLSFRPTLPNSRDAVRPVAPCKRRGRKRRGGSVIVMVALSMGVIFGCAAIAVDYGVLVSDANQLQRACDAAALGGAQKLYASGIASAAVTYDQGIARQFAINIARQNGVTISADDVTFPAPTRIKVAATRNRSLFFAQALGRKNGTVIRAATAGRIALTTISGAVPLAMTTDDYFANRDGRSVRYEVINLHNEDFDRGTVVTLDLRPGNSGKSPAVFLNDLVSGYDGTTAIGDDVNTLNASLASQGAKFEEGLEERFAAAARPPFNDTGSNYTYPNYPAGSPRVVTLIVANPENRDNSNPQVTSVFFVPVYLESVSTPNNKSAFVNFRILPSRDYSSQDSTQVLDPNAPITGPSVVSLFN